MRRTTLIAALLGVCACLPSMQAQESAPTDGDAAQTQTAPPPIVIGPETTVVDGPLRPDGTIDYIAVVNAQYGQGVTPENNAAIDLLQILTQEEVPLDSAHRAAVLDVLGVELPEDAAPKFIDFYEYAAPESDQADAPEDAAPEFAQAFMPSMEQAELDRIYSTIIDEPWTAQQYPQTAQWLTTVQPALARLDYVLATKERFYIPLVAQPDEPPLTINVLLPHLSHSRAIARALAARGYMRLGADAPMAAWSDVMHIRRLAALIVQEPLELSQLVGISIDAMAHRLIADIAAHPQLTETQARSMIQSLRALDFEVDLAETVTLPSDTVLWTSCNIPCTPTGWRNCSNMSVVP